MNAEDPKLEEVIFFLIEQTNRRAKAHSQQAFNESGLDVTVEQWVLLKQLQQHPGITQNELAELAIKDAASITRMLDVLQRKGLTLRLDAPGDRRKSLVALTPDGEALIQKHMSLVIQLREQGVKGISNEELALLKSLLLKMQANLS